MIYSKYSLDEAEQGALIRVAETCVGIRTPADFQAWICGQVKEYFPHETAIYALGCVLGEQLRISQLSGVNCPPDCLERFERITTLRERRIVQRWLAQHRAQIVNVSDVATKMSSQERDHVRTLGISNFVAFGGLDVAGKAGSYFCFGQVPGGATTRHAYKLELLLPYLHQTLVRVFHQSGDRLVESTQTGRLLTKRQRQILSLLATGLSNRAIAEKLSRSELTVQNHVHAIFKKLGVRSRAAAIAFCQNYIAAHEDNATEAVHTGPCPRAIKAGTNALEPDASELAA
jgi:transcriptional regulator EpsA